MDWIAGKKTYIGIITGTIWALLGIFGVVDPGAEYFKTVAALIVALTGVAARIAIEKSGPTS